MKADDIARESGHGIYGRIYPPSFVQRPSTVSTQMNPRPSFFADLCPFVERRRISISLLSLSLRRLFTTTRKKLSPEIVKGAREEARGQRDTAAKREVAERQAAAAASRINDRDSGLYGSAGLRVPRPLHKFRRAYNVKLIRRLFESSSGDLNELTEELEDERS